MPDSKPFRTTRRVTNLKQGRNDWYRIQNSADPTVPSQVMIYDEIGYFGVTAQDFINDLNAVKGDVEVHLNTPGGEVFDGIAIHNALKPRQPTIVVDSLAASIGSVIAMAAGPGKLQMAPGSQMMIHDGFGMGIGNAADMRQLADLLDKQSDNIASIYADRTGKPVQQWRNAMLAETWYTADEAVAAGLADGVVGKGTAQGNWDLSVFAQMGEPFKPGQYKRQPGENVQCPTCDKHNDSDASYCDQCGTKLAGREDVDDSAESKTSNRFFNADKYNTDDRNRMAASGQAMEDGSYPVADADDLDKAIHAVGRGGADHDSIRAHIIKRAAALKLSSQIPDNWNADGSLKDDGTTNSIDPRLLQALFSSALGGVKHV